MGKKSYLIQDFNNWLPIHHDYYGNTGWGGIQN